MVNKTDVSTDVKNEAEVAVKAAETKYECVVYDATTVAGMAALKEAKKELTKIRTSIEKTRVQLKQPYVDAGKEVDAFAKALTGRVTKLELPVKTALQAEEERQAKALAEQEEKHRLELEEENRKLREQLAMNDLANEKAKAIVLEEQAEEAKKVAKQELFDDLTEKFGLSKPNACAFLDFLEDGEFRHLEFKV